MVSACGAALSPGPPAVTCAAACVPGAAAERGAPAAWHPPRLAPAWVHWFWRSRQSSSPARLLFLRGGEEKKGEKRHHLMGLGVCMPWMLGVWGCREHGDHRDTGTTGTLGAQGCQEHEEHGDTRRMGMPEAWGARGVWEHKDAGSMGGMGTPGAWGCQEHGKHMDTRSTGMPGTWGTPSPQAAPHQGPAALLSSFACLPSSSYFSLSTREQWKG